MTVKKEYITERQGKPFVLYPGLIDAAHEAGLRGIDTGLVQIPADENGQTAICWAKVEMGDGSTFSGIGDASPANVNRMIAPHIIRMAETRAKARALRDALNVAETAEEELGGGGEDDPPHAHAQARKEERPRQIREEAEPPRQSQPSTAATANQLATIAKLSRMLGEPEAIPEELTVAGASDRISELSRLYEERQKAESAAGHPRQQYADQKRTGELPAVAAAQAHAIREDLDAKKKAPPTLAELMEACAATAAARGAGQEAVQVLQEAVAAKKIAAATPGKLTELERTILMEWVQKEAAEPKPLRI